MGEQVLERQARANLEYCRALRPVMLRPPTVGSTAWSTQASARRSLRSAANNNHSLFSYLRHIQISTVSLVFHCPICYLDHRELGLFQRLRSFQWSCKVSRMRNWLQCTFGSLRTRSPQWRTSYKWTFSLIFRGGRPVEEVGRGFW